MALMCPNPAVEDLRRDTDIYARVCSEFHDMPGLTLTLPQAARLFNLDRARCEQILLHLVHSGLLRTDGRMFARADVNRRWA
jgi:hypothetical protein